MKLCITIALFCLWTFSVSGQTKGLDSLSTNLLNNNHVQISNQKLDSIQGNFYRRSDSLRSAYSYRLGNLDSAKSHLKNRLDSLTSLQLPTTNITHALDSINQLREQTLAGLNKKLRSIKDETTGKIRALNLPPELNEKVTSLTANIEEFKLPTSDPNLPSLNLVDNPLGKVNDLNLNPSIPAGDHLLGKVNVNTPDLDSVSELKNVTGQASELSQVTDQVSSYSKEAQQIVKGNLSEVNNLPETGETKAIEMSGINEMKDQTKVPEVYKDLAEKAKDPEAVKEYVVEKVQQAAINHFAGKEQQLQQAMETVAKYKKQYASVPDISQLPKKRPNEMKGKLLIERFVPGITIQIQKEGEDLLTDFNPYLGYRLTGRITAGLGWNQRIAYSTKRNYFNSRANIYGPRAFGEYNLWKGFCPRAEVEVMNAFVPPLTKPAIIDLGTQQWVWGVFVGMKKDYRFLGRVKGTALVMMRLFDHQHKSPYCRCC